MYFSTIAAVSTPHGKGGIAVLRVSGTDAFEIVSKVFRPKSGKPFHECPPRVQIYGDILSFGTSSVMDDGLATCFPAPFSFTGENVVEISCHGGEVITGMVLSSLISAGAVLASPGEFSRRALLNGKLSLTAAEGIADLLDAKTEAAAVLSSKTARGKLSDVIEKISDRLIRVASSLWAYLDYPEEDLQGMTDDEMMEELEQISCSCNRLIQSFQTGRAVNSGIPAAIVGKPNVGKSTFFNALLGEEKAIVTSIPGTTRDLIEYPVKMGRILLNLTDTAGIRRETEDCIEKIGIERSLRAMENAEIIFALFDSSRSFDEEDAMVLKALEERKSSALIIPIFTKNDLPCALDQSLLSQYPLGMNISLHTDFSLENFIKEVEKYFIFDEEALRKGEILTNSRQKASLEKTYYEILESMEQIRSGTKDLASLTLESAVASLNEVDGKEAGEKILSEVFSRFCVGK